MFIDRLMHSSLSVSPVVCIVLLAVSSNLFSSSENQKGWEYLIRNAPFRAKEIFSANTGSKKTSVAGEAYRGLSEVAKFLGSEEEKTRMLFASIDIEKKSAAAFASMSNLFQFCHYYFGHRVTEGYKILTDLSSPPSGPVSGSARMDLTQRLLLDEQFEKAGEITASLGIIREWGMIGPWENISGSGYSKDFPPEKGIDLEAVYTGKDRARIRWLAFNNIEPDGWLYVNKNYPHLNAIAYYVTTVKSEADQDVRLNFGASGCFKIFVNDCLALADSVTRNTGIDAYSQTIHLKRGNNKLLIKIGHETGSCNFLARIVDKNGSVPATVQCRSVVEKCPHDTIRYDNLMNMPTVAAVEAVLQPRLAKDSSDFDAAIQLLNFYNWNDLHEKSQPCAEYYCARFPASALWREMYAESFRRSGKRIQSAIAYKQAYHLCPLNYNAWDNEFNAVMELADPKTVIQFLDSSYADFQNLPRALIYKSMYYEKNNEAAKAREYIARLESIAETEDAVLLLCGLYTQRGELHKVKNLCRKILEHNRNSTVLYLLLANTYLQQGTVDSAFAVWRECIKNSPCTVAPFLSSAQTMFRIGDLSGALDYVDQALKICPQSAEMLNFKAKILLARTAGRKNAGMPDNEAAKGYLREAIDAKYDDFDSWDLIGAIDRKEPFEKCIRGPDPDSLIKAGKSWPYATHKEGVYLATVKDVFVYPNYGSKEREFVMMYLPTLQAVEQWKTRSIEFNPSTQKFEILRAMTLKPDSQKINATVMGKEVYFKSLEPGDCILIEWMLENHYGGPLAGQIWGEWSFSDMYPNFYDRLRIIRSMRDTVPYKIIGDSINVRTYASCGYTVTDFFRHPYKEPEPETYMARSGRSRVVFSTLTDWNRIVDWYHDMIGTRANATYELRHIADSLFRGCASSEEKVKKVHAFITGAIHHSSIPLLQSGIIPQKISETLAGKGGDCKDIAVLGKSLFDIAGIPSDVVLVRIRQESNRFLDVVSPDFNHCILSYCVDHSNRFIDLTASTLNHQYLPRSDQGMCAIVVSPGNSKLICLPQETPAQRHSEIVKKSSISEDGLLRTSVRISITGSGSANFFKNDLPGERANSLQANLSNEYPSIAVDMFQSDTSGCFPDTMHLQYSYHVADAGRSFGSTVVLRLPVDNGIEGGDIPHENPRHYPIDLSKAPFCIRSDELRGELVIPASWEVEALPKPVTIREPSVAYSLHFTKSGRKISYVRKVVFNFTSAIPAADMNSFSSMMEGIARADDVCLVFKKQL